MAEIGRIGTTHPDVEDRQQPPRLKIIPIPVDAGSRDGPHATQKRVRLFTLGSQEWPIDRRRIAVPLGPMDDEQLLGNYSDLLASFRFCFGAKISLHAIAIIARRQIIRR